MSDNNLNMNGNSVIKLSVPVINEIIEAISPTVAVETIPGGHEVSITDKNGTQTFDVMDGSGGSGTDYETLTNKPQIEGVELTGDVTLASLGAASTEDIPDVSGLYTKPDGGIPSTDLASAVQTSLGKADSAYQKPGSGIPGTDLASGVLTSIIDDTAGDGDTNKVWSADKSADLMSAIDKVEDFVISEGWQSISLVGSGGYYQYGSGNYVEDQYRRSAVVNATEGEHYKITTHTGTTNIVGILYEDSSGSVLGYELQGTGSQQDHVDYEFTIPTNCTKLIVQSSNTTTPKLDKYETLYTAIEYVGSRAIHVGSDVIGDPYATTGWTENDGTWTHTSGNTDVLVIDTTAVVGMNYLLEFDSVTPEETVRIGLGDTAYRLLIYTDKQHKQIPLKAYGNCKLYIEPINSSYSGSISEIVLRPIQGTGTEVILPNNNSIFAANHKENYGFYNTILGVDSMLNSPGSTRCVAIGACALRDLEGGHRNIGIGTFAMSQMIGGEQNIAIGADAMLAVVKGHDNVAIGKSAGYNGTENSYNVHIGCFAGQGASGKSTEMCTCIGANAGQGNQGNYNTFIGANAGYSVTTGRRNTFVGANINGKATGDDNVCVGRYSGYPLAGSHCIAIGTSAVATKSNQMMLGSTNVTEVVFCGDKKINFNNDGTVTWETLT